MDDFEIDELKADILYLCQKLANALQQPVRLDIGWSPLAAAEPARPAPDPAQGVCLLCLLKVGHQC